jgi:hypothetical protein
MGHQDRTQLNTQPKGVLELKSNLISAIAGWKSAALLALVAMVAAVAFSGVLTNSQTAEAAAVDLPAANRAVTAAPGDTVNIVVADAFARVTITDTASGVGASFVANGGQSISCSDNNSSCDTDDNDANTAGRQNVADSVTIVLKVAEDSGEGHILLSVDGVGNTNTDLTKVITVSKAGLVGSLEIKTDAAGDKTIPAAAGTSNLTVTVKNASTPPGGLTGQTVSVTTTHGTVGCATGAGSASAGSTQTCSAATDAAGVVDVILTGGGVEGTATVMARLGTRTSSATVTLFGTAKNLTAVPDQASIEQGGSVYVVLTVTDGAGNPVAGQVIAPVTTPAVEVAGPEGVTPPALVLVTTEKDTAAPTPAVGDTAAGRGYSKDKPATATAAGIPACGDDNLDTDVATGGLQEAFGPNDGTTDTGEGTNAQGQCVVYVMAAKDVVGTPANEAATRGVHTLNFAIGAIKASAAIEVAGAPNSITTDAPDSVEPGSVTTITVSVWDDTDVLVGITSVKTRKVDGGGLIEDEGTDGSEMTRNGQSMFTFIAPSNAGSSEILITAGTVNHRVAITIGEAAPEGPAPTWSAPLAPGTHNLVWNGEDGADVSAGVADGVVAIWQWNSATDSWDGHVVDVPAGNNLTTLSNGAAYWVIVE